MEATPHKNKAQKFSQKIWPAGSKDSSRGKKTLSPHLLMMSGPGCRQAWQQNAWRRWTCRTPRTCPCRSGDPSPAQEHAANTNSHQTHTHEHPHQAFARHPKKKNWDWFNNYLAGLQLLLESLDAPLLFLNSLLCNSKSGLKVQLRIIAHPPTQPLLHFHFLVLKNSHFYTFTFWY